MNRIVDGDTIYVEGLANRVRLIGIDAPERGECGFSEATSALTRLIGNQTVTLFSNPENEQDRFGRSLAFVEIRGIDVGAVLITEGLVRPRYNSTDGFPPHQREVLYFELATASPETCANNGTLGILPADEPPSVNGNGTDNCLIKGNISRSGEKIFHMPGQQNYADTVINEADGERWFCTPEEAIAAGWRAARR